MGSLLDKVNQIKATKERFKEVFYLNNTLPFGEFITRLSNDDDITIGIINESGNFQECSFSGSYIIPDGEESPAEKVYTFEFDSAASMDEPTIVSSGDSIEDKMQKTLDTKATIRSGFAIAYDVPFDAYPDTINSGDKAVLGYINSGKNFQGLTFDGAVGKVNTAPVAVETVYEVGAASADFLKFTAEEAGSTVKLQATGSPTTDGLMYSTDGKTFTAYTIDTVITLNNIGDSVYFRNSRDTLSDLSNYVRFAMSGTIAASGNIQSMLNFRSDVPAYCYYRMFQGCASLTTAPELPATTLAERCYHWMFFGCTSLTTAPELPATTLADYCYSHMFDGCTSLTTAPELPATTLATYCYQYMFLGCTSLTTAPELPATTLAESCYYRMFRNCTSLTTAPELPATTLADYCYYNMFYGCSSLQTIKVHFLKWDGAQNVTLEWVKGVASTGTFYKPSALQEEYGYNYIPLGDWTAVNTD